MNTHTRYWAIMWKRRHPQNRKYITYHRNASTVGLDHDHRQHAPKFEIRPRGFRGDRKIVGPITVVTFRGCIAHSWKGTCPRVWLCERKCLAGNVWRGNVYREECTFRWVSSTGFLIQRLLYRSGWKRRRLRSNVLAHATTYDKCVNSYILGCIVLLWCSEVWPCDTLRACSDYSCGA